MQALQRLLPQAHFVYFGDTARVPYGNRSAQTVLRYCRENTRALLAQDIHLLVIACHTASALALDTLKQEFSLPIVGVVEGGVSCALSHSRTQRIAILGTTGTIQSGVYQEKIKKLSPHTAVFPLACPLFVPLVEEQWLNHLATRLIVKEYLAPLKDKEIDTVLLGCTHYPLLRHLIQEEMGEGVAIVDSAATCAAQVSALISSSSIPHPSSSTPSHRYYVSDDPDRFARLGYHLFGYPIPHVELLLTGDV